ncbi:hypothetical protein HDZ31DRAFT_70492 [Schizophyllum fasciatum]
MLDDRELDSLFLRAFNQQQSQLPPGDFDCFSPARLGWDTNIGAPVPPQSYVSSGGMARSRSSFPMHQPMVYEGTESFYTMQTGVSYGETLGLRPTQVVPPPEPGQVDPQWASFTMNR